MESPSLFMPSEVSRLILGYLKGGGYSSSYSTFLTECPHLLEYRNLMEQGREFPLTIGGQSLVQILDEYGQLKKHGRVLQHLSDISGDDWRRFDILLHQLKSVCFNTRSVVDRCPSLHNSLCVPHHGVRTRGGKRGTHARRRGKHIPDDLGGTGDIATDEELDSDSSITMMVKSPAKQTVICNEVKTSTNPLRHLPFSPVALNTSYTLASTQSQHVPAVMIDPISSSQSSNTQIALPSQSGRMSRKDIIAFGLRSGISEPKKLEAHSSNQDKSSISHHGNQLVNLEQSKCNANVAQIQGSYGGDDGSHFEAASPVSASSEDSLHIVEAVNDTQVEESGRAEPVASRTRSKLVSGDMVSESAVSVTTPVKSPVASHHLDSKSPRRKSVAPQRRSVTDVVAPPVGLKKATGDTALASDACHSEDSKGSAESQGFGDLQDLLLKSSLAERLADNINKSMKHKSTETHKSRCHDNNQNTVTKVTEVKSQEGSSQGSLAAVNVEEMLHRSCENSDPNKTYDEPMTEDAIQSIIDMTSQDPEFDALFSLFKFDSSSSNPASHDTTAISFSTQYATSTPTHMHPMTSNLVSHPSSTPIHNTTSPIPTPLASVSTPVVLQEVSGGQSQVIEILHPDSQGHRGHVQRISIVASSGVGSGVAGSVQLSGQAAVRGHEIKPVMQPLAPLATGTSLTSHLPFASVSQPLQSYTQILPAPAGLVTYTPRTTHSRPKPNKSSQPKQKGLSATSKKKKTAPQTRSPVTTSGVSSPGNVNSGKQIKVAQEWKLQKDSGPWGLVNSQELRRKNLGVPNERGTNSSQSMKVSRSSAVERGRLMLLDSGIYKIVYPGEDDDGKLGGTTSHVRTLDFPGVVSSQKTAVSSSSSHAEKAHETEIFIKSPEVTGKAMVRTMAADADRGSHDNNGVVLRIPETVTTNDLALTHLSLGVPPTASANRTASAMKKRSSLTEQNVAEGVLSMPDINAMFSGSPQKSLVAADDVEAAATLVAMAAGPVVTVMSHMGSTCQDGASVSALHKMSQAASTAVTSSTQKSQHVLIAPKSSQPVIAKVSQPVLTSGKSSISLVPVTMGSTLVISSIASHPNSSGTVCLSKTTTTASASSASYSAIKAALASNTVTSATTASMPVFVASTLVPTGTSALVPVVISKLNALPVAMTTSSSMPTAASIPASPPTVTNASGRAAFVTMDTPVVTSSSSSVALAPSIAASSAITSSINVSVPVTIATTPAMPVATATTTAVPVDITTSASMLVATATSASKPVVNAALTTISVALTTSASITMATSTSKHETTTTSASSQIFPPVTNKPPVAPPKKRLPFITLTTSVSASPLVSRPPVSASASSCGMRGWGSDGELPDLTDPLSKSPPETWNPGKKRETKLSHLVGQVRGRGQRKLVNKGNVETDRRRKRNVRPQKAKRSNIQPGGVDEVGVATQSRVVCDRKASEEWGRGSDDVKCIVLVSDSGEDETQTGEVINVIVDSGELSEKSTSLMREEGRSLASEAGNSSPHCDEKTYGSKSPIIIDNVLVSDNLTCNDTKVVPLALVNSDRSLDPSSQCDEGSSIKQPASCTNPPPNGMDPVDSLMTWAVKNCVSDSDNEDGSGLDIPTLPQPLSPHTISHIRDKRQANKKKPLDTKSVESPIVHREKKVKFRDFPDSSEDAPVTLKKILKVEISRCDDKPIESKKVSSLVANSYPSPSSSTSEGNETCRSTVLSKLVELSAVSSGKVLPRSPVKKAYVNHKSPLKSAFLARYRESGMTLGPVPKSILKSQVNQLSGSHVMVEEDAGAELPPRVPAKRCLMAPVEEVGPSKLARKKVKKKIADQALEGMDVDKFLSKVHPEDPS